ncbi:hypothetical protein Trydic_g12119 [Trypoxylus dichotomus]
MSISANGVTPRPLNLSTSSNMAAVCNRQSKECQVFRDGELKKLTILSGMFPVLLLSVCVPYRTIFLALPAIVSCININALVELCFKRDSVIVPRGIFMVLMLSTTVLLAVTVLIGLVLIWTSYIYSMCRNSSSSKPSHLAVKEFIPLSTYKSHRTQVSTDPVIVSLQEDTVPP